MTSKFHRILVPVDGSQNSDRAVAYAISLASAMTNSEIHLLNVQPPVTGVAGALVGSATLKSYHRDEGMKAMASALALCAEAGLAHKDHISVGQPGPTIAAFAKDLGCGQIIMGTRGLGATLGLLLGSVATDVIHHAEVPVTLVK